MAADTGNGVAITLATTTTTGWLLSTLDLGEETINDIDTSHLGTTSYMTYIPGDLKEPGEASFTLLTDVLQAQPPVGATADEKMTVTFPIANSGNLTAAKFEATGYIKRLKRVVFNNNELQTWEVTFKFDGQTTDPTFTIES